MLPIRDGSPTELAAVRDLLAAVGFSEEAVCQRTGVARIHELKTILQGRTTGVGSADALDALIRLFIDGLPVPRTALETLLPDPGLGALEKVGLVTSLRASPDEMAAMVRLYPTHGLYIASDLDGFAPGAADPEELEPPDLVFSAITSLTGTFLSQLPDTPCQRFLELCAGTGIAALAAARISGHVWAADITERSTLFAAFNARLNALENVSAVQGDLYEPVRGLTFDRIVAHPPYVPATETKMVYRDGGEDGEEIVRRILRGLPDHLETGGRFYLTCVGTDREGAPLEARIREMVGEHEEEFDLLVVCHYALPPAEYYGRLAASQRISYAVAEERTKLFRELRAERVVYASSVLQRHDGRRKPFTVRRERTQAAESAESEWLLAWSTRAAEEDLVPVLLDARPRLLPHARLQVEHRVRDGEWKAEGCKVLLEFPFIRTVELSLNAAMLLTLFDGDHTVREILQRLQQAGAIPAEVPPESFGEFVRELVGEGVLGLGGEPVPRAGAATTTPAETDPAPH